MECKESILNILLFFFFFFTVSRTTYTKTYFEIFYQLLHKHLHASNRGLTKTDSKHIKTFIKHIFITITLPNTFGAV